jgi:phosphotransferase system  glucose/maltose/N-acetylglucosamine-specific IIC component
MATIKLTPILRFISIILIAFSVLTFAWFLIELMHYVFYPIFNTHSLVGIPNASQSSYLWNIGLFVAFISYHLFTSTIEFKKKMYEIFPLYPAC